MTTSSWLLVPLERGSCSHPSRSQFTQRCIRTVCKVLDKHLSDEPLSCERTCNCILRGWRVGSSSVSHPICLLIMCLHGSWSDGDVCKRTSKDSQPGRYIIFSQVVRIITVITYQSKGCLKSLEADQCYGRIRCNHSTGTKHFEGGYEEVFTYLVRSACVCS